MNCSISSKKEREEERKKKYIYIKEKYKLNKSGSLFWSEICAPHETTKNI
jgi:hypothetical protein